MHKVLFFILTFILTGYSNSQNYSWITPNKVYLKMSVTDEGIYRINRTDFTNAGIVTSGIDPRTIKVYNKGNQLPVFFQGESDGVFDAADYLDFYGTRNYGGATKTYDENNTIVYTTNENYSLYSDTNAYWIDWAGANGLRMSVSTYTSATQFPQNYYYDLLHFEKEKIYWIGEYLNGNDFRNFTNERFKGETWYWGLISTGQIISDTFSTPLLFSSPQNTTVRFSAYPQNVSTSILNEHSIQIKINGNLINTITVNDYKRIDTTLTFSSSLLSSVSVNTVSATYIANGGFGGLMFIDYFDISYPKQFKFRNNQSLINQSAADTTTKLFKLNSFVPANPVSIYDVANGIKINAYTNISDSLFFSGKLSGKFEIINKNITKKPLRIIQRQVPDFVSSNNAADYLIIYNSAFESQASQLKAHREKLDEFRVTKAEIQDIYDIFNYGIEDPVAVRNFTRHVYNTWQLPKVKYICLFGRGSLDPKKNSGSTVYSKNFIPVYGNPSSDNYYSNINTNGFSYYNQISIGRLPANSSAEAQSMVDNIITYETQTPSDWVKSFTFIAGGVDSTEQATFLPLNDSIIIPYILPTPLSGNAVRIIRNDRNGAVTFNYADSILKQINRGTTTVNFMGHAGSQDWEIGMSDPNILSNYNGKFPLIFSMTCYTGKVGEPNFRSFGEKFMNMTNKGAIGYLGTSGWGFIFAGGQLNNNLYKAIAKDSARRIGDIVSLAINYIKKDSASFNTRHTMNCYTLQGDPAVKLLLPKIPEYSISAGDYTVSNTSPTINEEVTFTAFPKNFGTHGDSCKIRLTISSGITQPIIKDTVIRNFKYSDTLRFRYTLLKAGFYNLSLNLDYNNSNPNEIKSNNILTFNFSTKDVSFVQLKPVNHSYENNDTVSFTILNPYNNKTKDMKLFMELDTTKLFNSPLKKTFTSSNVSGPVTVFKSPLIKLDSNDLYYWRTNIIIGNDTSGWSPYQTVRYKSALIGNTDDKEVSDESKDEQSDDIKNVTVLLDKENQYNPSDFYNTFYTSGGIKLSEYSGNLYVRSLGSNGAEASYFNVLDKSIHIDGGGNTGLNLLKVRKIDGKIIQHKNFKLTLPGSSDSVLNFLNTFDSTQYLMGLNAAYVGGAQLLNANTIAKFNQFGSTKVHLFRIGFFDSWSFIGYLNAPASEVSEDLHLYNSAWVQSISSVNRTFRRSKGSVYYTIGSANSWKNFSWNSTSPNGSSVKFDVFGINRNDQTTLLLSNITTKTFTDLSSISAYTYPKLKLVANLSIDTVTGISSPVFNSFRINYTLPAEILPLLSSFSQSDTALKAGQELKFKFRYYNSGYIKVPGVIVKVYKKTSSSLILIKSDTVSRELKPDSSDFYSGKFTIPYMRTAETTALFIAEIIPKDQTNEFFTFNNYANMNLKINISYDNNSPVELLSDGQITQSGDYVRLRPEFKINLNTAAPEKNINDSSEITFVLNNRYVPFNTISKKYTGSKNITDVKNISELKDNSNNSMRTFVYLPELEFGVNKFMIKYINSTGVYDSTMYDIFVSDEFEIKDFYNYPNPMKGDTKFIFNLLGSESPASCKIKIYTVTGRLIKEINHNPVIGYNQIPWDGKDSDGDFIANGTYLYKYISDDQAGKETAVQKLVILR